MLFAPKYTISGQIKILNMPANYGLMVDLALFKVRNLNDAVPFGGNPPPNEVKDVVEVARTVDLDQLRDSSIQILPFSATRRRSLYYLQVRAVAFRKKSDGTVIAQAEQFFFAKRPLPLASNIEGVELSVPWPETPIDELEPHGRIMP